MRRQLLNVLYCCLHPSCNLLSHRIFSLPFISSPSNIHYRTFLPYISFRQLYILVCLKYLIWYSLCRTFITIMGLCWRFVDSKFIGLSSVVPHQNPSNSTSCPIWVFTHASSYWCLCAWSPLLLYQSLKWAVQILLVVTSFRCFQWGPMRHLNPTPH